MYHSSLSRWPAIAAVMVATLVVCPVMTLARDVNTMTAANELPTEALANSLHALAAALRDEQFDKVANHFAKTVKSNGLPKERIFDADESQWTEQHHWLISADKKSFKKSEFVAVWQQFLARFSVVEDMRFKVKKSAYKKGTLSGKVKMWMITRNRDGKREKVSGYMKVGASQSADKSWRLNIFKVTKLVSQIAKREIFSEVAIPAGLSATDPGFLDHPTLGLASHGAAVADLNQDGLLDIFATGQDGNFLYLNTGDGTFRDIADEAMVKTLTETAISPLFVDVDNDGDQDLFLTTFERQMILENRFVPDGVVMFWDVSPQAGVAEEAVGFSATAADVNGDGLTDVYVASYNWYGKVLPDSWDAAQNGTPNLFFVNKGNFKFEEKAKAWGIDDPRWSYAVTFADFNEDQKPDLFVTNDFGGGNSLFVQQGGRFVDGSKAHGLDDRGYGMGVSLGDYDNDGDLDLHITQMSSTAGRRILSRLDEGEVDGSDNLEVLASGNRLYENQGKGQLKEVSQTAGPFSGGWAWGGGFIDIDNDGSEDIHTPNGFLSGKSMKDT